MKKIILNINSKIYLSSTILSIFILIIYWIINKFDYEGNNNILKNHVLEFGLQSTQIQILIYIFSLLCIVLLIIYFSYFVKIELLTQNELNSNTIIFGIVTLVAMAFLFGSYSRSFAIGFCLSIIFIILLKAKQEILLNYIKLKIIKKIIFLCLISFLLIFVILPFGTPPLIIDNAHLVTINSHYAMTVLPGFDFICCNKTGQIERTNYGFGVVFLTAFLYKLLQPLASYEDNILYLIVRIYQLFSIVLVIYAATLINKENKVIIASLAVLTSVTMNTLGESNNFPNQSGIRYFTFLIGLIFILKLWKRGEVNIFIPSIGAAFFIIFNPETGFSITSGLIVLYLLNIFSKDKKLKSLNIEFVKFSLILTLTYILISYFSNKFFFTEKTISPINFMKLWLSGYGGIKSNFSVFAILLFFLSITYLIRSFYLVRISKDTKNSILQGVLSAIILVWLIYYVNRMSEWNLWFQAILYIMLIAPSINRKSIFFIISSSRNLSANTILSFCLIGALIFSSLTRLIHDGKLYILAYRSECTISFSLFQKNCFINKNTINELDYFYNPLSLNDKNKILILSHRSTQARLLGFNENFPWYEPFGEVATKNDILNLIEWIDKNRPLYIYMDNPKSEVSISVINRTNHFIFISAQLGDYEFHSNDNNWYVYKRIDSLGNSQLSQ
jgi:hypothetical protein